MATFSGIGRLRHDPATVPATVNAQPPAQPPQPLYYVRRCTVARLQAVAELHGQQVAADARPQAGLNSFRGSVQLTGSGCRLFPQNSENKNVHRLEPPMTRGCKRIPNEIKALKGNPGKRKLMTQ